MLGQADQEKFSYLISQYLSHIDFTKSQVFLAVIGNLGIDEELYEYTSNYCYSQPERDMQLAKGSSEAELKVRMKEKGAFYEPLEKAACLRHIEAIEKKKIGFMVQALVAVEMGTLAQEEIPFVESCAKIWAEEKYAVELDDKVDSTDIIIAYHKHDLENAAEFHAIMQRTEMAINQQVEAAL